MEPPYLPRVSYLLSCSTASSHLRWVILINLEGPSTEQCPNPVGVKTSGEEGGGGGGVVVVV